MSNQYDAGIFMTKLLRLQDMWDDEIYSRTEKFCEDNGIEDLDIADNLDLYVVSPFYNTLELTSKNEHLSFAERNSVAVNYDMGLVCARSEYAGKEYITIVELQWLNKRVEEIKAAIPAAVTEYLQKCKEAVTYKHKELNDKEYECITNFLKYINQKQKR